MNVMTLRSFFFFKKKKKKKKWGGCGGAIQREGIVPDTQEDWVGLGR